MNEIKNREINLAIAKLNKILAVHTDEILSPDMFTCFEEFWEYLNTFWTRKIPHFNIYIETIGVLKFSAKLNSNNYAYFFIGMPKSMKQSYVKHLNAIEIMQNKTRKFVINISAINDCMLALYYLAPYIAYFVKKNKEYYKEGSYISQFAFDKVIFTFQKLVLKNIFSEFSEYETLDENFEILYDELVIVANTKTAGLIASVLKDAKVYLPVDADLYSAVAINFEHYKYVMSAYIDKKNNPINLVVGKQLPEIYWPYH